jgi:hypothetical protein
MVLKNNKEAIDVLLRVKDFQLEVVPTWRVQVESHGVLLKMEQLILQDHLEDQKAIGTIAMRTVVTFPRQSMILLSPNMIDF